MSIVTASTRLICAETGEYPVFLGQMGVRLVGSFGPQTDSEVLEHFGYFVVQDTPVPVGDVVKEEAPVLVDNVWERRYSSRDYDTPEEDAQLQSAKAQLHAEIEQFRVASFEKGFPCLFNNDADLYHVQIRTKDLTNITALRVLARESVQDQVPLTVKYRVYENVNIPMDATAVIRMSNLANYHVQTGLQVIWDLKDTTDAATSIDGLPSIPAELFELK